ncbi:MAG: hypothetical protein ACREB3_17735 [Burkholderiales bacterium]
MRLTSSRCGDSPIIRCSSSCCRCSRATGCSASATSPVSKIAMPRNCAAAYALCRPPGHHAFAVLAGAFCFPSNTAIAAERCPRAGRRPAIVDVDLHHGNGTQGISYRRDDVLTLSVYVEPARCYPFFLGPTARARA